MPGHSGTPFGDRATMFVPHEASPPHAADQVNRDVPSPFALATVAPAPTRQSSLETYAGARLNGRAAPIDIPPARDKADFEPSVGQGALFAEAAVSELAGQIQHDSRTVAVIQHDLLERFLNCGTYTGRLHALPDPTRSDEVVRTLTWCRRLVQNGQKPVIVLTTTYIESLIGQFREKLCEASLPVRLIVMPHPEAGDAECVSRPAVPTNSVLAFLRLLPNTVIVSPKDGWELRQMLRFAAECHGPVVVQVPNGRLPDIGFPDFRDDIDLGRAEILEDGDDVVLLTFGGVAAPAVEAAVRLSEQGLSVGVVNARFVAPLDTDCILRLARRVRGIITVEQEGTHGGFGSAVLELMAANGLTTPIVVTGASAGAPAEAVEPASPSICARIIRSATALIEHRGQATLPHWESARTENGRLANPCPDAIHSRSEVFGIPAAALAREQDLVRSKSLSHDVEAWVRAYSTVGSRSRYLWKWCLHGVELTTLPCVLPELAPHVNDTKLLSIILCVLFDDVADQPGNGRLLPAMLRVTREGTMPDMHGLAPREALVADTTWRMWQVYRGRTATYPYHPVFADLLHYDLTQFFNTMSYSQLLNRQLPLLNLAEHDLYTSHNMQMISFSTLDLMCSTGFDMQELGKLREAMWHAQCMGRIGNLLSTWRREIPDRDFTSGVFARAVSHGDLTIEQLQDGDPGEIEAAILQGEHELYFYRRWLHHRERLRSRAQQIRSIDLTTTMDGHDRFFLMHLGSRGLI
jgi:transketolase C-terminal domain/subunit